MKKCFTKVVPVALCISLLLTCLPTYLAFADEITQNDEMPINSEITEDENEQLDANTMFASEEIISTEEVVITEETITTEEVLTTEEVITTEETLITEDTIELQSTGEDTTYSISSQEDWNNLVHGITDSVNWQDGVYTGIDDVSITLNCDIVSDIDIIKFTNDVVWNIDLNNNTFSSISSTFGVKFITGSGDYANYSGSVNVYNGIIDEIGLDFSKGMSNISISGVKFTNCNTTAINAGYCNGSMDISECIISHVNMDNTDVGINCSYINSGSISISDVSISDFYKGVMGGYTGATRLLNSVKITDACIGMDLLYSQNIPTVVKDCTISGNNESNSIGVKAGFFDIPSANGFLSIDRTNSYLQNCSISGFEIGIKCEQGGVVLYDSDISDVINGILSSPGFICVKDSNITASPGVSTYSGNSYGICNSSGNGYLVLNSTVAGFKVGSYNSGGSSYIIGSTYDNLDINADVYQSIIYGCSFRNAKIGIRLYSATVTVINSEIVGNNSENSAGIEGLRGSVFSIIGTDKGVSIPYSDYAGIINYVNTNMPDCHYKMVIKNYDIGAKDPGTQSQFVGLEIKDCTTGINKSSGQIHTGLNGQRSSVDNPVEIHDCINGVITSASCYVNGSDMIIHDCTETGFKSTEYVSGSGIADDCYKYEVYNCKNGFDLSSSAANTSLIAHNNKEKGIMISNDGRPISAYVALQGYDNGDYNVCLKGNITMTMQPGISTKTVNSDLGNVYIDINSSSEDAIRFAGNKWISDNKEIYLTNGRKLYLSPTSRSTDWLEGTMVFDVPSYSKELPVACVPSYNVYDKIEGDDASLWSSIWIRTHMFAEKEGWIITWIPQDVANPGLGNLVLHEGCEVTYDCVTNGGTEILTNHPMNDKNIIAYEDGSTIDLSLEGVKEGYEFVGWNTDKNAHEGLTELTAGTSNITLYAIYRTTKAVTYHTFDSKNDFTIDIDFYNNDIEVDTIFVDYTVNSSDTYKFVGYVLDSNEEVLKDNIKSVGDTFKVSNNCLDVYCVYDSDSVLIYKDVDGNKLGEEHLTFRGITDSVVNAIFTFIMKDKIPNAGYKFNGWVDESGNVYSTGSKYITSRSLNEVIAKESEILVDNIKVTPEENVIYIGEEINLRVEISPETALNKSIVWSIDNDSVATVDEKGTVIGKTVGTVTVTATNIKSGKSDTAKVIVKDARTDTPSITISDDYKVTLTPGEVVNDELDKLWYRINGGDWVEYVEPFPVYKKFTVEAYQITKIKKVESEIVEATGVEYATGIIAKYIGKSKLVGEDVINPEVIVTVHYPNSSDEVVTDFTLVDFTIKIVGSNIVNVEYNEYPDDENSPILKSQVTVDGYEEYNEPPTTTEEISHNEPKTGDNTMPIILFVLGVISLLCIICVLKKKHSYR